MMENIFERLREHTEPAHPMVVKFYDDLRKFYTHIRERYQPEIDKAFDTVSREIGFVVVTTVPFHMEADEKGITELSIGAEHLKGTIFDKTFTGILTAFKSEKAPIVPAGKYNFYLLWFEALKLKLVTDWMEPAHFRRIRQTEYRAMPKPEVMEPVHWFDPGIRMQTEDAIQISIIDEVYPELRLAQRVIAARDIYRKVWPGVHEPVHLQPGGLAAGRPEVREPAHFRPDDLAPARAEVMEPAHFRPEVREPAHYYRPEVREPAHFRPEVREPAHFRPEVREPAHYYRPEVREPAHFRKFDDKISPERLPEILSELSSVLRRYGF